MKNDEKVLVGIGIVAGFIILYLLIRNSQKNNQLKDREDKIADLERYIAMQESINSEIKKRLIELIHNDIEIEAEIANELGQILILLEVKQESTAIMKLAKIIENLLKELYKKDQKLKEVPKRHGRKNVSFADYLEHAKDEGAITTEDWHFLSVMKIIRNEEAHELAVKKESTKVQATLISGIGTILGLCRRLKKKSLNGTVFIEAT